MALVIVTQLACFVGAGGCAGRDDGAVQTRFGDDVDFDGRVAARVVDGACVDFGDRHGCCAIQSQSRQYSSPK